MLLHRSEVVKPEGASCTQTAHANQEQQKVNRQRILSNNLINLSMMATKHAAARTDPVQLMHEILHVDM